MMNVGVPFTPMRTPSAIELADQPAIQLADQPSIHLKFGSLGPAAASGYVVYRNCP